MSIDSELLNAFLKLLRYGKSVGVRDFQRLMKYRSPGKAKYVLEKLVAVGLVEKLDHEYKVSKKLPFYLSSYIILRRALVPRTLVYLVFTTSFTLTYSILTKPPLEIILVMIILILPIIYETLYLNMYLKRYLERSH